MKASCCRRGHFEQERGVIKIATSSGSCRSDLVWKEKMGQNWVFSFEETTQHVRAVLSPQIS